MAGSLTEVFQLAIEPTIGGQKNRGFFPTREVAEQGLVITELAEGQQEAYRCHHSPTAVDDANLAEHAFIVPGTGGELHDLAERLCDLAPAWFVDLGIGSPHFEGWIPRIISCGDEVVLAIGHECEAVLWVGG